ncbi:hypothetical protein J4450_06960 [Candidatus Micrarchaeota archaeon]|nr:hypothetical protein [Candidatus Micrarchaeota archaeon]
MLGKAAYLKKLTSKMRFRSVEVGEKMDGSSPPSVFIGSYGYPTVYVGPMLTPQYGDTSLLDSPEEWIPREKQLSDIVQFRLQLVRGKAQVCIKDFDNKLVSKMQEISLSKNSIDSEAEFKHAPRGITFNEEHAPFGPSAAIKRFNIDNVKWEHNFEKVYHDTDLLAGDGVVNLYKQGYDFTQIQKAFSTGTMGLGKNRKLVPTRWSITAVDSIIGEHYLDQVKHFEIIDSFEVYEFTALNNYFAILLTPTPWQYEWIEAFIHVLEDEEAVFSDYELYHPKKEYSNVGGCYYSVRSEVTQKLAMRRAQAGAIVFREAYPGYIPTGVWLCREETKHALAQKPNEFFDLKSAISYISSKLKLPFYKFHSQSVLLKEIIKRRQMLLANYL